MPANQGSVVNNKLDKGLITEATGLNFPEDAMTDGENIVLWPGGPVRRRLGIDVEGSAETLTYSDSDGVIVEFVWHSVAKTGGFTFLAMQVGDQIRFYQLQQEDGLSSAIEPVALNLNDYKVAGNGDISNIPCQMDNGAGYLYVVHPACDPIIVRYNTDSSVFEAARITILVRDFDGLEDGLGVSEEPATLTPEHHYNLLNQGWDQKVRVGTVSNELGEGGPISTYIPPKITFTSLS